MPCNQRELYQDRNHARRHNRCSHPPGWPTFLLAALIMTTTIQRLDHPPSLSSHHPALLDAPARLSLAADISLKEAYISEVSKKIPSAVDKSLSKKQKEFFLCQQLTAIRKLSAVQRSVSDSTKSSSANDGAMSELGDDDQRKVDDSADLKKIETIQSGIEERKAGMRERRRLKRIPHESV